MGSLISVFKKHEQPTIVQGDHTNATVYGKGQDLKLNGNQQTVTVLAPTETADTNLG